jgi:hypothetical protein
MAISADYATPLYVNGYACMNCTQVAEAKQNINPADPQAGPFGIDAKSNPTATQSPAVVFGGVLASAGGAPGASAGQSSSPQLSSSPAGSNQASSTAQSVGALLNISV